MRKTLTLLTTLILALTLVFAGCGDEQNGVHAEQKQLTESVVFQIGTKEYFANNQTTGVKMDAAPMIQDNRTYVPVRFLANALGVGSDNIGWEAPVVTLSEPGFPVVELTIEQKRIVVDGEVTVTDVAPVIRNGRTMLPARFVAEALGYQVDWRPEQRAVVAWPKGVPEPDIGRVLEHLPSAVTFPDANLEAAVRKAINKPTGEITAADLAGLTELKAPGLEIKDLSGLEHAVNLVELDLSCLVQVQGDPPHGPHSDWQASFNQISDLSPLSGLANLTKLNLNSNQQITDLGPLADLTNLTELVLNWNQITDLAPLAGLTNLTELHLNANQITDISSLADLTNLTELNLSVNQISDLSALSGLANLTKLNLHHTQITDLSLLADLPNLAEVVLDYDRLFNLPESRKVIETLEARGVVVIRGGI